MASNVNHRRRGGLKPCRGLNQRQESHAGPQMSSTASQDETDLLREQNQNMSLRIKELMQENKLYSIQLVSANTRIGRLEDLLQAKDEELMHQHMEMEARMSFLRVPLRQPRERKDMAPRKNIAKSIQQDSEGFESQICRLEELLLEKEKDRQQTEAKLSILEEQLKERQSQETITEESEQEDFVASVKHLQVSSMNWGDIMDDIDEQKNQELRRLREEVESLSSALKAAQNLQKEIDLQHEKTALALAREELDKDREELEKDREELKRQSKELQVKKMFLDQHKEQQDSKLQEERDIIEKERKELQAQKRDLEQTKHVLDSLNAEVQKDKGEVLCQKHLLQEREKELDVAKHQMMVEEQKRTIEMDNRTNEMVVEMKKLKSENRELKLQQEGTNNKLKELQDETIELQKLIREMEQHENQPEKKKKKKAGCWSWLYRKQ